MAQSSVATKKSRVFVVDDHPIVRQGLALMINREADLTVCGEAEDTKTSMQSVATARPDILVVDISLNGPNGLDLLKKIRTRHPELPVLILSIHDESIYSERALRAGAQGYIMKQRGDREGSGRLAANSQQRNLCQRGHREPDATALYREPERGQTIVNCGPHRPGTRSLPADWRGTRDPPNCGGVTLSVKTVESNQAHIKEKLSLRSGRELVQHAIQWSIREKTA